MQFDKGKIKIKTLFFTDRTLSALMLELKRFHLQALNWDRSLHLRNINRLTQLLYVSLKYINSFQLSYQSQMERQSLKIQTL